MDQPRGASGWRDGHEGLFQYRVLRRFEAERTVAARIPRGQGKSDRRNAARTGQNSRRPLEFFATYFGQHGGSGQRSKRGTGREALWGRSPASGGQGRPDRRNHAQRPGNRGPRSPAGVGSAEYRVPSG